ncbi:MAG TPA: M48 family metalloprotease [Flavobacteriales bacterium]|nr:M48 family metalloprotease [Flavobacteriales bacterium]
MKPTHPDELITPAFRKEVKQVLGAIIGFGLLYLLLMIGALALLAATVFAGIAIIMVHPSFITLAIGGGIAFLGIMVCIFMVKFIFMRTRAQQPVGFEVSAKDEPEIIALVERLADDLQAPRPRHVRLIPDVNASVSYTSTFWSMILPVRKDLNIGLGLVNTLNVGELRAVLAHEFGHFSQRSMKLGSYVYTVNKAIFDLVQHRDSWDRTLEGWAEAGGVFGWFAVPTFHIVQSVRRILVSAYQRINRRYYSLSRQMEFHADALAARAQGGSQLISALYKAEYSGMAWDGAMNELGTWMGKGHKAKDVYAIHSAQVGFHRSMPLTVPAEQVFADIRREQIIERPRLVVRDQWASHPSLADREAIVAGVGVDVRGDERPAWTLFKDEGRLRERMSALLYERAPESSKATGTISPQEHVATLQERSERFKLDDRFHGVFDGRTPKILPLAEVEAMNADAVPDLHTFYTPEVAKRHAALARLRTDVELLRAIRDGQLDADTFELDGVKHPKSDATECARRLEQELADEEIWSNENDRHAQIAAARAAREAGGRQAYADAVEGYLRMVAVHDQAVKVLVQGQKVHAMATAKPRFDQHEWSALGAEAGTMYHLLQGFLKDQDPATILDPEEHKDQIRAMERVQRAGIASSTFEPDVFWGTYENTALLEMKAREKRFLAFKALTQVQCAWLRAV